MDGLPELSGQKTKSRKPDTMNAQRLLRILTVAIVVILAATMLGVILKVAGFVLSLGFNSILVLLLAAIAIRFYSILRQKR